MDSAASDLARLVVALILVAVLAHCARLAHDTGKPEPSADDVPEVDPLLPEQCVGQDTALLCWV